jgi:CheY-like chemotaxis protein
MVILITILTVATFVAVDLALRLTLRRMDEARERKQRRQALDVGLRLDFTDEAKSLKRVAVEHPKARILAVDDEPVILDGFRKILVLAGYSVDTVETGQEALGLVRSNDYDFVFTDLKMPGMDGLDVTKAVKHLRPDVDVAIITGYATIETAVSGMKHGACDYVEKPFTEDELVEFVSRLLIRRQDRQQRLAAPQIHLVTPSSANLPSPAVVNVPGGVYVSGEHAWVSVEINGEGRIGLDDFFQKSVGPLDGIRLPEQGQRIQRGATLFTVERGGRRMSFVSPLTGKVTRVNHELDFHLGLMRLRPYEQGWICAVEPADLTADLDQLTIGADAVTWYQAHVESFRRRLEEELARQRPAGRRAAQGGNGDVDAAWTAFGACFLRAGSFSTLPAPREEATLPACRAS